MQSILEECNNSLIGPFGYKYWFFGFELSFQGF